MNYKYNCHGATFEASIDYNGRTLCPCGCGEYAQPGEAYIPGHFEDAKKLTECLHIEDFVIHNTTAKRMYENKECPQYLGVVVAEQVLAKVFKNVERMRYGNPGYDFICSHDYLVDSKCSTNHKGCWSFNINHNKIADYFVLLAFDDRENLNPQHLWLVPGDVINHLKGMVISESTTPKWSKYEQPIDRVIECCNTMR